MIELDDADAFAHADHVFARLDGHDSPPWKEQLAGTGTLLARFGRDSPIRDDATHGTLHGRPVVYVAKWLDDAAAAFPALHERGHIVVRQRGLRLACHEERWCNRFAAASLAPAPSVRRAWRASGADLAAAMAARPGISGSILALRLAEVGEVDGAELYRGARRHSTAGAGVRTRRAADLVRAARAVGYAENDNARAWLLADSPGWVALIAA